MTVGPDSWPPEQVPIQLSRSCRQERLRDKRRCEQMGKRPPPIAETSSPLSIQLGSIYRCRSALHPKRKGRRTGEGFASRQELKRKIRIHRKHPVPCLVERPLNHRRASGLTGLTGVN